MYVWRFLQLLQPFDISGCIPIVIRLQVLITQASLQDSWHLSLAQKIYYKLLFLVDMPTAFIWKWACTLVLGEGATHFGGSKLKDKSFSGRNRVSKSSSTDVVSFSSSLRFVL